MPQDPENQPDEQLEPRLKEINLNDIKSSRAMTQSPFIHYSVESLQIRILDLEKKLNAMQAMVEKLGPPGSAAANAAGGNIPPDQLGALLERVKMINERVNEMWSKLQGTLGYDIYHQYQCEKCGSEGFLATTYKCTRCGGQSWRGWWPGR